MATSGVAMAIPQAKKRREKKERRSDGKSDGVLKVDLGSTTKGRLKEVARLADTDAALIVEKLVDHFLGLDAEKQKPFIIMRARGVVVI